MANRGTMRVGGVAVLASSLLVLAGCGPSADDAYEDDDEYYYEDDSDDYDYEEEDDGPDAVDVVVAVVGALSEDDDRDDASAAPRWRSVRSDLVRDPASGDQDDRGSVEVRASRRAEALRVQMAGLEPFRPAVVLVENPSGIPVALGSGVAGSDGRASFIARTGGWAVLPTGDASIVAMAGRRIEVRDGTGTLLRGRIPALGREGRSRTARVTCRDDESGVRAVATLVKDGKAGRRQARIDVRGAAPGSGVEWWVEDGTGALAAAGSALSRDDGSATLRFDSRRGDPLPGGAEDLASLSGRRFEVRIGGDAVLEGAFPAF